PVEGLPQRIGERIGDGVDPPPDPPPDPRPDGDLRAPHGRGAHLAAGGPAVVDGTRLGVRFGCAGVRAGVGVGDTPGAPRPTPARPPPPRATAPPRCWPIRRPYAPRGPCLGRWRGQWAAGSVWSAPRRGDSCVSDSNRRRTGDDMAIPAIQDSIVAGVD